MTRIPEETVLYIVAPCYNEEEALPFSAPKLVEKLNSLKEKKLISADSKIIFVDDGSVDKSWEIIGQLHSQTPEICGISLAHNRGHQNALLAGLMFAKKYADVAISIDADLQQDINAMEEFLAEYYKGSEIVFGIRNSRNTDSKFKKGTAKAFYGLMGLLGAELYPNSADYRLMSQKALEALSEYHEVNLFLRGIIPDIGLKTSVVHFDVFPREQGQSKYTLKKMMTLAIDGITSFSIKPIHFIAASGIVCMLISVAMIVWVFFDWLFGNTVVGYSTLLISLWFIGGLLMFSLGIVGEYVGRAYEETKNRPRYYLQDMFFEESGE